MPTPVAPVRPPLSTANICQARFTARMSPE